MKKLLLAAVAFSAMATPAFAAQGNWLIRLRGIMVSPTEESGPVLPSFPTGFVSVDDAYVPELDFTYFLTDNIGAELILATSPHNIGGEGALSALGKIADTMALPPTLLLQWHFLPREKFRPYVGVGVNWTIFYNDDASASLVGALGPTSITLENSVGYAVQAGFDVDITERFFFNADVKYIDIDTTAAIVHGGGVETVDVSIDPLVFGVGFGMRF